MRTSQRGLKLIELFEGFSSVVYRDSVGVPTIGYGTTSADIDPLPIHCTRAQAEDWLASHLRDKYEPSVNRLGVPLNQNQYDALVSLAYNVGPGVFGWQIGIDLRARRYAAAADDFMHYVYAGGRVLQGLVNRRRAERTLFLTPIMPPPPPDPYARFDHIPRFGSTEAATAQRYDVLRATQTHTQHPHRAELEVLRALCKRYADRIRTLGHLELYERDWRQKQLAGRAAGRRYL